MSIFQGRWFNLVELDRIINNCLYPLIALRAWFALTPLLRVNGKGNNNTMRMLVPISRSTIMHYSYGLIRTIGSRSMSAVYINKNTVEQKWMIVFINSLP